MLEMAQDTRPPAHQVYQVHTSPGKRGLRSSGSGTVEGSEMCCQGITVCPGSLVHFQLVTHYIKIDQTSWRTVCTYIINIYQ